MDLGRLRCAVALADELHFTRASQKLGIAQPALSQQIRRLERELNVRLFERTRRSVKLTDAGRLLVGHARILLEAEATARRDLDRATRGEIGVLALGFVPSVGGSILPEAFRAYRTRFPDVAVELREVSPAAAQVELLLQDQIQIGLSHYIEGSPRIRSERITTERFTAIALPAGHRLAKRRSVDLRDVLTDQLITGPISSPPFAQLIAVAEAAGASPRVTQASDVTTRLVLVAAGVGCTLLLSSAPRIDHPGIVYRPLTGSPVAVELHALTRSDQKAPHVMAFIEVLRSAGRERDASPPRRAPAVPRGTR